MNIHYGERGTILVTRKQTMLAGTRRVNGDPVGAGNVQNSALFAALIRGVRADRTTERVLFHMGMAANAAAYVRIQKGDYFPTVDDIVQTLSFASLLQGDGFRRLCSSLQPQQTPPVFLGAHLQG